MVLALAFHAVKAQDNFPTRPIKVYVPFPAGGTADILPRILAEKLSKQWPQGIVVENKPGAGGNIGAELVYNSEPDGYTLLASPPGPLAINKSLYQKLSYDSTKFEPVTIMAEVPNVLVVSPNFPAKNLRELIAYAQANPDKVNFASQGNGSTSHLTGMMLQSMANIKMTHIAYKGTTPALTDIMGGQVDIFFDNLSSSLPFHKSGKLRILAVADSKRSDVLPDIPTVQEAGIKGFKAVTWFGIVAPPGTPEPIIQKLNKAFVGVMKTPEVKKSFLEQGAVPIAESPEKSKAFIRDEAAKWGELIKKTRTTVD
jgi:tripartite-type tricarboxylate transporter receptor subunit TctC